jgi:hypothetical protein
MPESTELLKKFFHGKRAVTTKKASGKACYSGL